MMANAKQLDVLTNNLANANTNAYKKDTVIFESFPSVLTSRINDTKSKTNPSGKPGEMNLGSDIGEVFTYYTQGELVKTNNNSDFAIDGSANAFFSVKSTNANGGTKEYYTRDGAFVTNTDNQLVTRYGDLVLGQNGPITVNSFADLTVQEDGTISQGGKPIDKFKLSTFDDTKALRKYGFNLVAVEGEVKQHPFTGNVRQGFIEQSNVNNITEMINMINVMRSYEANQKVLQQQDNILGKAVNEVGVLR
jgi:flagellar basal-body rod protein FlgG